MTTTYASLPGPGPVVDASTTEELLRRYADLKADHLDPADLRHRIIEKNLPMANRLARHYVGRGERLEDLGQVAALALINAVDRFDPGRQIPFDAYAIPTIVGALKRHFRDAAWGMRVPRSTQELARTAWIGVRTLTQRHGRAPTTVELADHLGVGVDELRTAIGAWQAYHPMSLNVRNPSGVGELLDLIGAVDPRFAGVDDHQSLRVALAELTARERLDPRPAVLPRDDPDRDRRGGRRVTDAGLPPTGEHPRPPAGRAGPAGRGTVARPPLPRA